MFTVLDAVLSKSICFGAAGRRCRIHYLQLPSCCLELRSVVAIKVAHFVIRAFEMLKRPDSFVGTSAEAWVNATPVCTLVKQNTCCLCAGILLPLLRVLILGTFVFSTALEEVITGNSVAEAKVSASSLSIVPFSRTFQVPFGGTFFSLFTIRLGLTLWLRFTTYRAVNVERFMCGQVLSGHCLRFPVCDSFTSRDICLVHSWPGCIAVFVWSWFSVS